MRNIDAVELFGRRGGGLVALFTTTVALAGGAYALAPASAAAFQSEEGGCTEVWEGTCVGTQEDGSGGGGGEDAGGTGGAWGGGADDGTGWDGGADPGTGSDGGAGDAGQTGDNGAVSGSDDSSAGDEDSAPEDPFLLASNDSTKQTDAEAADPAWQMLERKIREAEEFREEREKRLLQRGVELDHDAAIELRARADLRAFDPGHDIWQAAKCEQTAFPLRCGVFWATLAQRVACENLGNLPSPSAEPGPEGPELIAQIAQCRTGLDELDGALQELVKLGQRRQQRRARATPGRRRHGVTARSAA